jgi:ABC-type glycerol-3-phosphate transport system substrate-binding protein
MLVAAAAAAAGTALAACARGSGGGTAAAAAPAVQKPKTILQMRAWGVGSGAAGNPSTINQLLYDATAPWRAKNRGVDIKIIENNGGPQAVIAAILAGNGPDIYHSWHPETIFSAAGIAADLRPYLKQYNADLTVFNKAQMDLFMLADGSIRALPYYLGIETLAVCEGILDTLGLPYPAENWTYQDYATLATSIARGASKGAHSTQPVYGGGYGLGNLGAPSGYLPPECILNGFGGSYVDPANGMKSNLDAPGSVAAVNWAFDLARVNALTPPGASANFGTTLGMAWAPSFFLPSQATGWRSLKWQYYSMPTFPVGGQVTGCTSDLWAMNPSTPNPDLAFSLLYWCAFEPQWQVSQMEIFLLSPALLSLWDRWLTYVPQLAPPLANKNLSAFVTLAKSNTAYPQQFQTYAGDSVYALINQWGASMWTQKTSVTSGLQQLAAQTDAFEISQANQSQQAASMGKRFPVNGKPIADVVVGI